MLRFTLPFLLSGLFLLSFGCEKNNFEIAEETPEMTDPIIIETEDENYISYGLPNGATVTQVGTGLITEQGFVGLATSETAIIECLDGVISLTVDGSGLVLLFLTDPSQALLVSAYDLPTAPGVSAFQATDCESTAAVLDLITLTDEQVVGNLSVELFTINPDNPTSFACEDLISLGVIDIDFNVALETCN